MSKTQYILPDGILEVTVVVSRKQALGSFLEFVEGKVMFPSARFSQIDFEDLEAEAENLEQIFSQVPVAMKVFLDKYATFEFWTSNNAVLLKLLKPYFSSTVYREACLEHVLRPLYAYVKEQSSRLVEPALIASRKVHDFHNRDSGIVKSVIDVGREVHIKNEFCKQCDTAFHSCIAKAVNLARENLSEVVSYLLRESLVQALGKVKDGLDICSYQKKVQQEFNSSVSSAQLKSAMSLLPFEPIVIRRALEVYGDKNCIISSVAQKFGVDVHHEKVAILDEVFNRTRKCCEKDVLVICDKFKQQMAALELEESSYAISKLQKIENRIASLDKLFRTVEKVVFPTRLEAVLTRNDVKFVSSILGEDVSYCVRLLARANSFFKSKCRFSLFRRSTCVIELSGLLLEKIEKPKVCSPFLKLIERALLHCKDYPFYAGNERFKDEVSAQEARCVKRTALLELFRSTPHPRVNFRLSISVYFKLKVKGIFALFKKQQKPLEMFVLDRFLGESFPKDIRSLYDLLKWQLGCDFFEKTDDSFVEISPEGLSPGYISTTLPNCENGPQIFAYEDLEDNIPKFTLQPYYSTNECVKEPLE